jgi:hypothetical protein
MVLRFIFIQGVLLFLRRPQGQSLYLLVSSLAGSFNQEKTVLRGSGAHSPATLSQNGEFFECGTGNA